MTTSQTIENNTKRVPQPPICIKLSEVVEILGMDKEYVRQLMKDNVIRSFCYGGNHQLMTSRKEVELFVERCLANAITHELIHPTVPEVPTPTPRKEIPGSDPKPARKKRAVKKLKDGGPTIHKIQPVRRTYAKRKL